jgi:diaminopimelate decarboxylase
MTQSGQPIRPLTFSRLPNGEAGIGECIIKELVNQYGSPLYVMDQKTIITNCQEYTNGLSKYYPQFKLMYAGKANLTIGLLDLLASKGIGVDVVSGGELYTALQSQMNPENITFHGNNKSIEELQLAIDHQVTIVLDNFQELENVLAISSQDQPTKVMARLKPEIDAHTHEYIKTGHSDSKFGFNISDMISVVTQCHKSDQLQFLGIHSHIGSQIFDVKPYIELVDRMVTHMVTLKKIGIIIPQLNLGGGIGICYTDQDDPLPISEFIKVLSQRLVQQLDKNELSHPVLMLEPGRSIVGNAGITVYTIGTIKEIPNSKTYVFINGGMADNPRPMMYQSEYTVELTQSNSDDATQSYTIAGRFCESGDILAKNIQLKSPKVGDLLIVYGTGAYNYSMASNYNRTRRPAMVIVNKGHSQLLVQRESFEDLVRLDCRLET